MKIHRFLIALGVGLLTAHAAGAWQQEQTVKHVLLISVHGLHALDLSNYVKSHPNSALSALTRHGLTYTNNQTSSPSDSFPGLAALVTGGSPVTSGFWYDVTWNRALSPPAKCPRTSSLPSGENAVPGTKLTTEPSPRRTPVMRSSTST